MDENPYAAPRENPYAAPRETFATVATFDNPVGIWRDRKRMVILISNPQLPPRCVKTNEPFDGTPTPHNFEWIPNRQTWMILLGVIGLMIAKALQCRKFSVLIPVSQDWLQDQKRAKRTGWAIILGGVGCFVLGAVVYALALGAGMSEKSAEGILFAALGSLPISLLGAIYLALRHKPAVALHKVVDDYAWLNNVHPDYLDALPEWPY